MKKKYLYIFFISFFILWKPFHAYFFHYDAYGRIITILSLIFLGLGWSNLNKRFIKDGKYFDLLYFIWVIWVVIDTTIFNPFIDPEKNISVFIYIILLPFLIYFAIRLNFANVPVKKQWLWFFMALLLYLILVLLFERNSDKHRLGLFINSNEIAWIALLILFTSIIIIRNIYIKYFIYIIVFVIILLTASKKAFLSYIMFFLLKLFLDQSIYLGKRIFYVVFLLIFSFSVSQYILQKTLIGERIQKSVEHDEVAEDNSELFDGRANFYIKGYALFKEKPITGIGITNFYYLGNMGFMAHSEYVVQFAELGIIGFLIFLMFHYRLYSRLIILYRKVKDDNIPLTLLISFFIIYSMFLGRWVYDNIPYSIFLALTVNTLIKYNKKHTILIVH